MSTDFSYDTKTIYDLDFNGKEISGEARFAVPPFLAETDIALSDEAAEAAEQANAAMMKYREKCTQHISPQYLLLSVEACASSMIEDINTSFKNLYRSHAEVDSNQNSLEAARNLECLIIGLDSETGFSKNALLDEHSVLMENASFAGHLREEAEDYVWIGGQHGILDAYYIAPLPEKVETLIDDCILFSTREDISLSAKLAISHAQFESIHPFLDGNGRTGRVAIQKMLTYEGLPPLPLSSGLFALRDEYIKKFADYRSGDINSFVRFFSLALECAANAAAEWSEKAAELASEIGKKTEDIVFREAIMFLFRNPVFAEADMQLEIGGIADTETCMSIISEMMRTGVISEGKKRWLREEKRSEQTWESTHMFALSEELHNMTQNKIVVAWIKSNRR